MPGKQTISTPVRENHLWVSGQLGPRIVTCTKEVCLEEIKLPL